MAYTVKVIRNVRIPMPDGITLAADLYLPEVQGQRVPAIIEYTPYHKVNNSAYGPRATRYPFFASQGYVFVNVDIRGTGDSEGFSTSPTSESEVQDGVAVIQWCAEQAWCDGHVGMIGISYTAGVCFDAARQAPPALKAVVLCQMCSDWYQGMACPGGTLRLFAMENFAPLMAAYNYAPPVPELLGEQWEAVWRQRLERSTPWSLAYVDNLLDGPFWQSRLLRDDHDKVKAATFLIGGAFAPKIAVEDFEQIWAAAGEFIVDGHGGHHARNAAGDAVGGAEQGQQVAFVGVEAQRAGGAAAGAGGGDAVFDAERGGAFILHLADKFAGGVLRQRCAEIGAEAPEQGAELGMGVALHRQA
ncbi:MAG: CocE/NonD family hydrolase, partial [Rhodospirillales bacterium]|nr:CocE/NonD family hydrolase [Rhodospirillales bacterium]